MILDAEMSMDMDMNIDMAIVSLGLWTELYVKKHILNKKRLTLKVK
jgi:hypothetical protein